MEKTYNNFETFAMDVETYNGRLNVHGTEDHSFKKEKNEKIDPMKNQNNPFFSKRMIHRPPTNEKDTLDYQVFFQEN